MAKGHRSQIKRERNEQRDTRPSAKISYARISVQKACYVLDAIRGKDVQTALGILAYNPRYASAVIEKLLKSAIANAENNNGMSVDNLYIEECYANKGPTMKRIRPRAQGRAYRIEKMNVPQHYRYIKYSEKCRHDLLCIIFRIRKYKHCHLADQIRHKKQHKPCMFFSREIFFHINKRIIPESKNITDNSRRFFLNAKHFIKF